MFLKRLLSGTYSAEACSICGVLFKEGLLGERVHKCKRCERLLCAKCGPFKERVLEEDGSRSAQKHRLCLQCKADYDTIQQSLSEKEMRWCRDGRWATLWTAPLQGTNYEYDHFLKLFYRNQHHFQEELELVDKDVLKGRTDYTVFDPSTRQFLFSAQETICTKEMARIHVANLLYAVAARFDRIGYCQGMSAVAAFLLTYCCEKSAFAIFCYLLQDIYPANFFVRSDFGVALIGLMAQLFFLKEYFLQFLTSKRQLISCSRTYYDQDDIDIFISTIDLLGAKALLSLFVGMLNFTNLIFVWEQLLLTRNFAVIERAFITIIYLNRDVILAQRSCKKIEKEVNFMDHEAFKELFAEVSIDETRKAKLIEQYYSDTTKHWMSKNYAKNLCKVTNFTQDQIQVLQRYFSQGSKQRQSLQGSKQRHFSQGSKQQSQGVPIAIRKEQFVRLIECYYQVLKADSLKDESILQISSYFVKKIFEFYNTHNKKGLDFREFVCCLSVCTKSKLKERICAVINTFKDKNQLISKENVIKLIEDLSSISPPEILQKKEKFTHRMNKYFANKQQIQVNLLYVLLTDDFINDLTVVIKSDCKDIIGKACALYHDKVTF